MKLRRLPRLWARLARKGPTKRVHVITLNACIFFKWFMLLALCHMSMTLCILVNTNPTTRLIKQKAWHTWLLGPRPLVLAGLKITSTFRTYMKRWMLCIGLIANMYLDLFELIGLRLSAKWWVVVGCFGEAFLACKTFVEILSWIGIKTVASPEG